MERGMPDVFVGPRLEKTCGYGHRRVYPVTKPSASIDTAYNSDGLPRYKTVG